MEQLQKHLGLKPGKFEFRAGDTVKVHTKVVEGDSERIQIFDGTVISRRGSGIAETFTVRKISYGVGVERVFPIHSPASTGSSWSSRARSAGPRSITCASSPERRPGWPN